jgi:calcineurin-like phosphoesterase family protein
MTVWFTSDTHFGHKRIIELAKRPFASVEEMDEMMIYNWNNRVQKDDIIFHLGDFAFADHYPYLQRLNGLKYLITGNHDHKNRAKVGVGWQAIYDSYRELKGHPSLVLCHYALRVWNKSHHGAIHLYGHSHNNLPGDSQSCDVGVDAWNFYPVTLEMIKQRLAEYPKRIEPDHHNAMLTT